MQRPPVTLVSFRRNVWRVARPALGGYVLLVLMFSWFERWLVFPAPPHNGADWVAADLPHEDVFFKADDGTKLHGWFVEHPSPRAVVMISHGNGEHVARLKPLLELMRNRLAVSVFAWDYRGYGRSEGKPREDNVLSDARKAQLWVAHRAGVRPDDVVLWGRSLGGGVAVGLASKFPARGLVLERTFAGLVETAAYHFPWLPVRWLMRNEFRSIDAIQRYHGPLLQVHGTADQVVPFEMGKRLFDAAPSRDKRLIVVDGGGHNDPQPDEFYDAADEFFDALPAASTGALNEENAEVAANVD
jgi:fermentation-respiration switch protein FrsA (DUF1100 family)